MDVLDVAGGGVQVMHEMCKVDHLRSINGFTVVLRHKLFSAVL